MRVVSAGLLAVVASAQKACLSNWNRDTRDQCQLYSELAECKAQAAMCAPQDLVYIQDKQGKLNAMMLEDLTYQSAHDAAATLLNANDAGVELTFHTTYAGQDVSFGVDSDAALKMAMSVKQAGYFTADYVVDAGWFKVGTLSDWDTVIAEYKPAEYAYGVTYNTGGTGVVHEVTPSSWNKGIRLMTEEYMQGDKVRAFEMGVAVFYKGLNDAAGWTHMYYQHRDGNFVKQWSNGGDGGAAGRSLYVKKLANPWILAGAASTFDDIVATYPLTEYRYGIKYNSIGGFVHDVNISGWNRGVRLTTEPYMMGDNGASLWYGVVVFARGTDDQSHTWEHNYYKLTGGSYDQFHSNGAVDTREIWVKKI